MKNLITGLGLLIAITGSAQQSEREQISETLNDYIEGTSYSYPERIKNAFNDEANLFLSRKDEELWIVKASEYATWFEKNEPGKFTGRIGDIISIDQSNDIATAKVEILMPERNTRFVDLFLLKKLGGQWKILSKSATREESVQHGRRILFIVSNAHFYGDTKLHTGNSYSEIVNAYQVFLEAGYTIDFVSPEGGAVPLAYINTSEEKQKTLLYNQDFMAGLKYTMSPGMVDPSKYSAVYYVGGGSAMYGVPENEAIQQIVMEIYEEHQGIVSSVCHGTAGIVNLKTADGEYLVKNKTVNGYPDEYEKQDALYYQQFPFKITQTIELHGGTFNYAPRGSAHVEVDGRLITGQNHLSSAPVANKIIEMIEAKIALDHIEETN